MRGFVKRSNGNYYPRTGLRFRTPRNRYRRDSVQNNGSLVDRKVSYQVSPYVKRKPDSFVSMAQKNYRVFAKWQQVIRRTRMMRRPGTRFIAQNIGSRR